MATFFSKHKELRLHMGEKVTKTGDKEVHSPIILSFQNNMLTVKDEKMVEALRAHPMFKENGTGGFHETDEGADRAVLVKNKQLVEQGEKVDIGEKTKGNKGSF